MKKQPKPEKQRRESPQDFILAFVAWMKRNKERRITAKAFAILRGKGEIK